MIITTLFARDLGFERGEVEVKLLPGIPQIHIVGLPDRSMRECGIRLKSALKSAGFSWPRGHQIVVNLRPSYVRKESAGIDLAVALGVLVTTGQLDDAIKRHLGTAVVYGELALDGRVFAPADVDRARRTLTAGTLLTGRAPVVDGTEGGEGEWLELARLNDRKVEFKSRRREWASHLVRPKISDIRLTPAAFEALWLTAHLNLNVLVAGPQGSGKTTWARAVFAATRPPDLADARARADLFGEWALGDRWRPLERPHHTATPLAIIGGGRPLVAGVLSRAHGGVLIMDEFLEFNPAVLEALREPLETGEVEVARAGERRRLPARVQLIATSNLCPCGELNPDARDSCRFGVTVCKRTCARLSGPILDRFDLLLPSHPWLRPGERISLTDLPDLLARLDRFATARGAGNGVGSAAASDLDELWSTLSHRRRRAIARVARGLADFDESVVVTSHHRQRAYGLVVSPMEKLRKVFG